MDGPSRGREVGLASGSTRSRRPGYGPRINAPCRSRRYAPGAANRQSTYQQDARQLAMPPSWPGNVCPSSSHANADHPGPLELAEASGSAEMGPAGRPAPDLGEVVEARLAGALLPGEHAHRHDPVE